MPQNQGQFGVQMKPSIHVAIFWYEILPISEEIHLNIVKDMVY